MRCRRIVEELKNTMQKQRRVTWGRELAGGRLAGDGISDKDRVLEEPGLGVEPDPLTSVKMKSEKRSGSCGTSYGANRWYRAESKQGTKMRCSQLTNVVPLFQWNDWLTCLNWGRELAAGRSAGDGISDKDGVAALLARLAKSQVAKSRANRHAALVVVG